jgi:hypothetical protein
MEVEIREPKAEIEASDENEKKEQGGESNTSRAEAERREAGSGQAGCRSV